MSKGNNILINGSGERSRFAEGIIDDTSKPGAIMQIVGGSAQVNGRWHWKAANTGTDGKAAMHAILLEDSMQGFTFTQAYVSGTICFLYFWSSGDELNCLLGEVAGTGNTYAIGDRLILDAEDGILVPESGSPQESLAVCLETVTQQAGSRLTWCQMF